MITPLVVSYGFLIGVAFFSIAVLNRFLQWIVSPLRKLPGPKSRFLPLGNFVELFREPRYSPPLRWWTEAGCDKPLIHFTLLLWTPNLLIMDKDIVKTILASSYGKDPPRFSKRAQVLIDTLGNGLVAIQGSEWSHRRRILQPAFNTKFLKESMTRAIPYRVKRFMDCWIPAVDKRWEIDVASHISTLTLDIVGDVAFSHSFNALGTLEAWSKQIKQNKKGSPNEVKLSEVGDQFLTFFSKMIKFDAIAVGCLTLGLGKLNWYINRHLRETRYFLDAEVDKIVAKAHRGNTEPRSLLELLLTARDPEAEGDVGELCDSDLRDEVKTFMITGYETISSWLHWAIFALVKHPDVQERLRADVVKHASAKKNEAISLETVLQMEYLNAFLQEVLRMYPPVGSILRYNTHEEKWHDVTIPPDTRLVIASHLLHRHPKYWDEPDTFLPERWIDVSLEEVERRRFAFIPFSAGGRNCIGQQFATMEAKMILAPLVRAFRFVAAPSQRATEFTFSPVPVMLKPTPSFKVSLENW